MIVGLLIATLSGYFSVIGLAHLFGNGIEVFLMASFLEIAKVISVSFITGKDGVFKSIPKFLSRYILITTFVLMLITSLGVYGYLSSKYQLIDNKIKESDIQLQQNDYIIKQYESKIIQVKEDNNRLNSQINNLTKVQDNSNNSSNRFLNNKNYNRMLKNINNTNDKLNKQIKEYTDLININSELINTYNDTLSKYNSIKMNINIKSNSNSDVTSLKFIGEVTGIDFKYIVSILIFVLVLVFDPLAISLIMSANYINDENNIIFNNNIKNSLQYKNNGNVIDNNIIDNTEILTETNASVDDKIIDEINYTDTIDENYNENYNEQQETETETEITTNPDGIYDIEINNDNADDTNVSDTELHGKYSDYSYLK